MPLSRAFKAYRHPDSSTVDPSTGPRSFSAETENHDPTWRPDVVVSNFGTNDFSVDQRHLAGDAEVAFADINVDRIGSGCDGHPSLATHVGMGMNLTMELRTRLAW